MTALIIQYSLTVKLIWHIIRVAPQRSSPMGSFEQQWTLTKKNLQAYMPAMLCCLQQHEAKAATTSQTKPAVVLFPEAMITRNYLGHETMFASCLSGGPYHLQPKATLVTCTALLPYPPPSHSSSTQSTSSTTVPEPAACKKGGFPAAAAACSAALPGGSTQHHRTWLCRRLSSTACAQQSGSGQYKTRCL